MDRGDILVVRLSDGLLGQEAVTLLGSAVIDQFARAAMSRADIPNEDDRRPFILCADEFQRFATPIFGKLIEEARKYRVATMVAHQRRTQLPEEVRDALMSVRTHVVFEVSGKDAQELSREFTDETPELMTPPDLYAHLERKGHPDPRVMARFVRLRHALDAYPAERANAIRRGGGVPDTALIRLRAEEQKDYLSRSWHALQEDNPLPNLPLWPELREEMLFIGAWLLEQPIRIPHRTHSSEERLTALAPFTAKVKWRDGQTTHQTTIRMSEPPRGTHWRPPTTSFNEEARAPAEDSDDLIYFDEEDQDDGPPPLEQDR